MNSVNVKTKSTSKPNMAYILKIIMHIGMKWWLNECGIVTVLEQLSVICTKRVLDTNSSGGKFWY